MAQQLVAGLIGDMVRSRDARDRGELQQRMAEVLDFVDAAVGGDPVFTLGDEFQASYPTVESAIEASLQLHLRSIGLTKLRIGVGWGELLIDDPVYYRLRTGLVGGEPGRPSSSSTVRPGAVVRRPAPHSGRNQRSIRRSMATCCFVIPCSPVSTKWTPGLPSASSRGSPRPRSQRGSGSTRALSTDGLTGTGSWVWWRRETSASCRSGPCRELGRGGGDRRRRGDPHVALQLGRALGAPPHQA